MLELKEQIPDGCERSFRTIVNAGPVPQDRDWNCATSSQTSELLPGKEFAMDNARVAMHSIEEVRRLHHECGCLQREIARSCGLSAGAAVRTARRVAAKPPVGGDRFRGVG